MISLKYGKPIWQLVSEAANSLEKEIFTASDIVNKVHETQPEVIEISIKSNVIAMAPNHPFSWHWISTRKNHPYFFYLGDGKFRLLKENDDLSISLKSKSKDSLSFEK